MPPRLGFLEAEDLRLRLLGLFDPPGPFIGRDLRVASGRIRLAGGSGVPGLGLGGVSVARVPRASYQWLHFDEVDGGDPAGEQTFTFEGENIPFVGAITEVDLFTDDDKGDWQVQIGVNGIGSIFRTSLPDEVLEDAGFFRIPKKGFWPETEGLTFPLPSPGLTPFIKLRRPDGAQKNLTYRLLLVAHPSS